jgi:putative lipoic acid-binding regulatory protein
LIDLIFFLFYILAIFVAMLEFPVRYTFNSVGKTGGNSQVQAVYVDAVKKVMLGNSGSEGSDMVCQITPRGTKFVKVKCEVEVHSAGMINLIYDQLGKIDNTVMKF